MHAAQRKKSIKNIFFWVKLVESCCKYLHNLGNTNLCSANRLRNPPLRKSENNFKKFLKTELSRYFTLLYFTLLYFTLLYFTLLYFTLLYFTLLYFTLRCCYDELVCT